MKIIPAGFNVDVYEKYVDLEFIGIDDSDLILTMDKTQIIILRNVLNRILINMDCQEYKIIE